MKLNINKIYFLKQFFAKFSYNINITNFKKSLLCLRASRKSLYKIIKLKFIKNTKQQNKDITKIILTNKNSKKKKLILKNIASKLNN